MKKIILVFLFLALSSLISFFIFPHKALAVCKVGVSPNSIVDKSNENVTLYAIDYACLGVGLRYTIFAYPQSMTLDKLKPLTSVKGGASSNDGQTLEVSLNFNDIISGGGRGPSTLKPHNPGPWTVLVCSSNKCDDNDRIAEGEFNLISIPPTPTPTPPSDLPIIDHTKQEACTFQLSYDQSSITIKVQNIDPSKKYVWWWDTSFNKKKESYSKSNSPRYSFSYYNSLSIPSPALV